MVDLHAFIPQGFTEGTHPMIAPALARRLERAGRRSGPQRLIVRVKNTVSAKALDEFWLDRVAWGARMRLPGLYELDMLPDDIDLLTGRDDLFEWVDVATRLSGTEVTEPQTRVVLHIAVSGERAPVEKAVGKAGGTLTASADHDVVASVPAAAVADLLRCADVDAIDVAAG